MGRISKLWKRKDRPGWWSTVRGRQVCLGEDHATAVRELHARLADLKPATPDGRVLVAVAVDQYLAATLATVKAVTHECYWTVLQKWIDAHGRTALSALTEDDLTAWLERPGWSKSTRHLHGSIVRQWAAWCVRRKLIATNPFAAVRLPGITPRKPPLPGALEAVIAGAPEDLRDFLVVCLELGCRPGELCTLEASSVLWGESTAEVDGKTGPRLIGLSTKALDILKRRAERHPTGPVLRNSWGRPWTTGAIRMGIRKTAAGLGIKGVVAYHCRHAFWARAVKAGVGDVAVCKQLGHSSPAMLAKTYAHPDHQILRETARRASGETDS